MSGMRSMTSVRSTARGTGSAGPLLAPPRVAATSGSVGARC